MKNIPRKAKVTLIAIIAILVIAKIFHYVVNYRFGGGNISVLQAIGLSTFVTSPFWLIVPIFNKLDNSIKKQEEKIKKIKEEENRVIG